MAGAQTRRYPRSSIVAASRARKLTRTGLSTRMPALLPSFVQHLFDVPYKGASAISARRPYDTMLVGKRKKDDEMSSIIMLYAALSPCGLPQGLPCGQYKHAKQIQDTTTRQQSRSRRPSLPPSRPVSPLTRRARTRSSPGGERYHGSGLRAHASGRVVREHPRGPRPAV